MKYKVIIMREGLDDFDTLIEVIFIGGFLDFSDLAKAIEKRGYYMYPTDTLRFVKI